MERIDLLREEFSKAYGREASVIARAPGRVNLIGEHTDYNAGYVFPIAIDRDILIAASPADGDIVSVGSVDFTGKASFSLANIEHDSEQTWSNYPRGVAQKLIERGKKIGGANLLIQGNVPLGSGLSSSAALEVAVATAFQALYGFEMTGPEMALLCQAAENQFVGMNCGIMDQFISRLGEKDHALLIDCRSLGYETVPLPAEGVKIIVSNTNKKHSLVDSEYNARRAECEEAVSVLKGFMPHIEALRDVTVADFEKYKEHLSPVVRVRAEHVVTEDDRVLRSVEALRRGDVAEFGKLMYASHASLRDLYQVSCRELDVMVEAATGIEGVYGSRMTGGGFGGCTVSLVADAGVPEFMDRVPAEYEERTGIKPTLYLCTASAGAGVLPI